MTLLRQLDAYFSPWGLEFGSDGLLMRFHADEMTQGQFFSCVLCPL